VATVAQRALLDCTGFRVVGPDGPVGRVVEAWLGPDDEPAALAVRHEDGRRGLLLALDVESVDPENRSVRARAGSRILELTADGPLPLALHPAHVHERDPSVLRTVAVFLPALTLLVALEIALAFTIAYLVTGRAY
jgi:hypothetical protein